MSIHIPKDQKYKVKRTDYHALNSSLENMIAYWGVGRAAYDSLVKFRGGNMRKKIWNASRICVSSLRRGHANLLCIVPILVYVPPK